MNPFVVENLKSTLRNKKVLLGVSGSIAAFKACDLVRFLKDCEAEVKVILTDSAKNFVTPLTLETLSGHPVLSEMFGSQGFGTHHIDSARWADVILLAPATANLIAKYAQGIADDLLSTELLAFQGPVALAPAMNPVMFAHPAVQKNLNTLRSRGVQIIGPAEGDTACGEVGLGRMSEPDFIIQKLAEIFYSAPNGKKAIVSMGPTRSDMDRVRFLTNRSSGLMGASLAWALVRKGYQVLVVQGASQVQLPVRSEVVSVSTTTEMADAILERWPEADLFASTAAVLDFEFEDRFDGKIKKEQGLPELKLQKTVDILKRAGELKKPGQFILGFAAEARQLIENAKSKLEAKNCDAVFVNDISKPGQGFESDSNSGSWVTQDEVISFKLQSKVSLADQIVNQIEKDRPHEFHAG